MTENRISYLQEILSRLRNWDRNKVQGIHKDKSTEFARKVIGYEGNAWNMLINRVHIDVHIDPTTVYEEDNNKTVRDNIEEVRRQLKEF